MSRRGFITAAAGGAIAPFLSCTTAPRAPGDGASSSAQKTSGVLPSYVPFTSGPKPDYRSADSRVVDAFEHYPKPFMSWTKEPPGTGSRVEVLIAA